MASGEGHARPAVSPLPPGNDVPILHLSWFAREPGYFLGAMYFSYLIGVGIVAAIALPLWAVTGWSLTRVIVIAALLFLPLVPTVTLLSRVLWIYLDQTFDPEGR